MERVAKRVRLTFFEALAADSAFHQAVASKAITLELGEDVLQRLLANAAHTARGELQAVAVTAHIAFVFELLQQRLELFERLCLFIPHQIAQMLQVHAVDFAPCAAPPAAGAPGHPCRARRP